MRRTVAVLFVLAGILASRPGAAEPEACADGSVRGALAGLAGFEVMTLESGGGARVVLKREQPPLWLMLSLGFRDTGLNTFAFSRGDGGSSRVPANEEAALNRVWDRLGNDAAAKACAALRMPDEPVAEKEYARLDQMFQALQPSEGAPAAAAEAGGGEEGGYGWMILVALGALALALWIVRARTRRTAAPPAAPAPQAPAPAAETPAPAAETPAAETPAAETPAAPEAPAPEEPGRDG